MHHPDNANLNLSNPLSFEIIGPGAAARPAAAPVSAAPFKFHTRDRDRDGYIDDLERLLGSSPLSAASVPAGFRTPPQITAFAPLAPCLKVARANRRVRIVSGRLPVLQARRLYEKGWLHMDNVSAELYDAGGHNQTAALAGYAACRALAVALYDETFSRSDTGAEPHWSEPYLLDPAEHASAAYAGGHPGDPSSDPEKRRAYWLWYCRHAVPGVLSAAPCCRPGVVP